MCQWLAWQRGPRSLPRWGLGGMISSEPATKLSVPLAEGCCWSLGGEAGVKGTPNVNDRPWDWELPSWALAPRWPPLQGPLAALGASTHESLLVPGVYFPALTSLLSQKVPESERAFTYSTVGAGSQFG